MAANTKVEESLISIQKQYFQMVPVKMFDWKDMAQHVDTSLQKAILEKTCMCDQFGQYTPSVKYQRMFLKNLMKMCEEANSELADELYESYTEVIRKVEDDQISCYKTYILPSGSGIVLQESQNIISQGTTGLSTWQAALYMLEWVLENQICFKNRNVLELGCGLGLLGLSICVSCSPRHYVFTDCHEAVLEKLNTNLSINGYHRNTDSTCHHGSAENGNELPKCPCIESPNLIGSQRFLGITYSTSNFDIRKDWEAAENVASNRRLGKAQFDQKLCHVKQHGRRTPYTLSETTDNGLVNVASVKLDWKHVNMEDLERLSCGIILATDTIYDVELIKFFVRVLFKLLSCHGDGISKPIALVASTVRNVDTFQSFLLELEGCHIKWTVLDRQPRKLFFYDDKSDIRLVKLEM